MRKIYKGLEYKRQKYPQQTGRVTFCVGAHAAVQPFGCAVRAHGFPHKIFIEYLLTLYCSRLLFMNMVLYARAHQPTHSSINPVRPARP